jgi:hypothetical protein
MQTTLRINDRIFREAKAEAARAGVTLTRFIENALSQQLGQATGSAKDAAISAGLAAEIQERNRRMEALLQHTAHFRVGPKPTREEMNERQAVR